MNASMTAPISGPVPTFSPSFAQLWVTPALIGLAWQMKLPEPQAPARIDDAQLRARLVSCESVCSAGRPLAARVWFTRATKEASLPGDAAAGEVVAVSVTTSMSTERTENILTILGHVE